MRWSPQLKFIFDSNGPVQPPAWLDALSRDAEDSDNVHGSNAAALWSDALRTCELQPILSAYVQTTDRHLATCYSIAKCTLEVSFKVPDPTSLLILTQNYKSLTIELLRRLECVTNTGSMDKLYRPRDTDGRRELNSFIQRSSAANVTLLEVCPSMPILLL